jgi:hypothetical protein
MVIESLISNKRNLFWTVFHILLGLICTISPFALVLWFYLLLILNFNKALFLLKQKNALFFVMLFSYLISFELLDRMAKTSPFIPYELGKYMLVFMGLVGIYFFGIQSKKGLILLFLIIPAVFYDLSGQRTISDIINNFLGPLAVALGISFSNRIQVQEFQLDQILKLVYWACIATLIYTFIKTPDFDEIEFSLKAQFGTTGGHSSNQVSTLLGFGMFLSFYSLYNKKLFLGNLILDIIFLIGFSFQGLLSFSRGGMIVALISILFILIFQKAHVHSNKKSSFLVIAVLILFSSFYVVNKITKGNLILRYKGETQGTQLGLKELTLNQYSTGRLSIFQEDLGFFYNNIVFGVGCGSAKYFREREGVAAHNELSRLLAEHGLFGLVFAIIFYIPIFTLFKFKNNQVISALIIIALLTTLHQAMRTFVTPLIIILTNMSFIKNNKKTKRYDY